MDSEESTENFGQPPLVLSLSSSSSCRDDIDSAVPARSTSTLSEKEQIPLYLDAASSRSSSWTFATARASRSIESTHDASETEGSQDRTILSPKPEAPGLTINGHDTKKVIVSGKKLVIINRTKAEFIGATVLIIQYPPKRQGCTRIHRNLPMVEAAVLMTAAGKN